MSGITFGNWSSNVESKIASQFGGEGITAFADFWTPHFIFHPAETYFPLDFNDYIKECSIRFVNSQLLVCPNGNSAQTGIVCPVGDTLSAVYLGQFAAGISAGFTLGGSAEAVWSNLTLSVNNGKANPIIYGDTVTANAPIYVIAYTDVGETMLYVTYIHMYGFNGPYHIIGGFPFDAHFADIEHVVLEFELEGLRLNRIYFAAHGTQEGVWIDAQDVQYTIDGTPVVYISLNSHASQQSMGIYFRSITLGLTNDLTGSGRTWSPQIEFIPNFIPVGDTMYGWLFFQGTVGNGNVANLPQQDWTSWIDGNLTGWNSYYINPTWSATLQFIFWFSLAALIILLIWLIYVIFGWIYRLAWK